ncbi:hypothetical protein ACEQ6A_15500 [Rhizobium brockwellii]|uniref:hypothetical protein n=1 Tax=Rhizobium brockwellii TaxID=3019932 RepID=UPI003F95E130
MAGFPVSPETSGLRRLAVGGVAVTSAYEQIRHHLASTLGSAHAALFAEPVTSDGGVDWYCDLPGEPRRLVDLNEEARSEQSRRLSQLIEQLETHMRGLRSSLPDYQRHLGQLLELALQIPDDLNVWVVGDQPVLTFWGYTRELGEPARSPLYKLLPPPGKSPVPATEPSNPMEAKPMAQLASPSTTPQATDPADEQPTDPDPITETKEVDGINRQRAWYRHIATPRASGLLLLLAIQAFMIGFLLLRSCSLSLPFLPVIDYCFSGQLRAAEVQTNLLATQRNSLAADITNKETACRASPAQTLRLDLDAKTLAGCWRKDSGIVISTTGRDQVRRETPVVSEYCFDETGDKGRVSFKGTNGFLCEGPMTISRSENELSFEHSFACMGDEVALRVRWICRASGGATVCDGVNLKPNGELDPEKGKFTDAQFYRAGNAP